MTGQPEFEEIWRSVKNVEGWLTRDQARELFEAARRVPSGSTIVEIGSHHGKSTVVLAKARQPGVRVLAVDPFYDIRWGGGEKNLEIFLETLYRHGVASTVALHRGTSVTADVDGPIGLVYVDGAHDRRSVLTDLDAWMPRLAAGGALYLHDAFSSPGVTLAILERLTMTRTFRYIGSSQTLAMFRRVDPSTAVALISVTRIAARLSYLARNLAIKTALMRGWPNVLRVLRHPTAEFPY